MLHPRVGGEDEVGRDHRPDGGQPDASEVESGREPPPAEDPQPDEGRLEEEGDQRSMASGAPKIDDVAGVERPVHADLELLDDARDDADGQRDEHNLPQNFVIRR